MPPVTWYPLHLIKILKETKTTWRFIFDIELDGPFNYKPGQFLTCDLPTGEKRAQRWRSYSIANSNQLSNEIEFCISYKKDGLASEYFFNQIKVGDSFKCKGPEGNFILPEQKWQNLFLICTGTGLAPFRPMLQEMQINGHDFQSINLIFGTRLAEDLIYKEDIVEWNKRINNFHSHLCFSREQVVSIHPNMDSVYHYGYVHQAYQQILQQESMNKSSCLFMICGWSEMIDQAVLTLFTELCISREQIKFELYG
jgi:CDP-4-dehydro-6-deoxyglucose reductase